jgi:hypothetical protein
MNQLKIRFCRIEPILLFLIPVLYFIAGSYFRNLLGNISLRNCDPEYIFFMSGLTLSDGLFKVAHIDNPGTPLQVFLALTFRIIYFFRGSSYPYIEDVLLHPDLYLAISNLLITALTAGLLLYAGKKVLQYTNSILYAVLIQTAPFLPVIWYDLIGRIVPELILPFPVILLTVLVIKICYRDENPSSRDVFLFAIISSFGMAVKLTYLPLWVIPLFIVTGWKRRLTFIATAIILFFIIAFPVALQIETFWGWIKNLIIHSGQYGKGDSNLLNLSAFRMNMKELFYYERNYFNVFFGLIATFVVYLVLHRKKTEKRVIFIAVAVILTVFIQLILVGKHFAHRYFIPVLMLSPLMVFLIAEMIRRLWKHKSAIYVIHAGIVLFLLWQIKINHRWLPIKSEALKNDIENRIPTWHYASLLDTKENYLFIASQNYGSPFIEYTLTYSHIWGHLKKRLEYAPILDKLYPYTFNYFPWDNSLRYWTEGFDVIKISTSGKLVYLYLENDDEELYSGFLDKLKTESDTDFSADRNLLYKNPATSEVIYLWNFKLHEHDH